MKKIFTAIFMLVGSLVILPAAVLAQNVNNAPMATTVVESSSQQMGGQPTPLVHAYKPYLWQNTYAPNPQTSSMTITEPTVKARVNNWTPSTQTNRLVCVEAMQGNVKNHQGCLRVDLSAMGTTNPADMWAREFNAPLRNLRVGNYNIVYNSQDASGNWYQLTNVSGQYVPLAVSAR